MPDLDRALDLALVPVWDQAPEQGLRALVQAAPAWVLDQVQERVKEVLGLVAVKDQTALDLVMEQAMGALVRQTVQALARATAPVRAGMDLARAANNSNPSGLL
jgi:hypothetical protein